MDYERLVEAYEKIEATSKKIGKTAILADLLKQAKPAELRDIVHLMQGKVFPPSDEREIGVSTKLAIKAISAASGESVEKIESLFNKEGDLGKVAELLLGNKKQTALFHKKLTAEKVVAEIRKIAEVSGAGAVEKKLSLIAGLLGSASPREAKYIIKTIIELLRSGVKEGILRDAIVWAFLPNVAGLFPYCEKCNKFSDKICVFCNEGIEKKFNDEIKKKFKGKVWRADSPEEIMKDLGFAKHADVIIASSEENARKIYNFFVDKVQAAYDLSTDFGEVAVRLKEKGLAGLEEVSLVHGKAIKVMLFVKAENFADAFSIVGRPAIAERKFDGFRMQIHGKDGKIWLFTRRLDDVTAQFPDVVEYVKNAVKAKSFILDSEVVGIDRKTGKFVPFQNISQRIKRKYEIARMVSELPVIVELFDAIEINGKNLLNEPFEKRRTELEKAVKEEKGKIVLVEQFLAKDEDSLKKFYEKVLKEGVEGVMLKNKDGIYKPGARVGYGVKIKPTMETLDLAITKAEWGEGKRASWLSSFTVACMDNGDLKEIGKVGSGIKEKSGEGTSYEEITEELKKYIVSEKGSEVIVKPKVIVEVAFQEIQKSPTYDSGYALRFPRIVRVRSAEKGLQDINTLADVERLYKMQAAKMKKV